MGIEIKKLNTRKITDRELFFLKNVRDFYTSSILDWQYSFNNENSGLFLGYESESVFASQGMIPISLAIGEKNVLTAKSESSFLSEKQRGKGYFEKIYDTAIQASRNDKIKSIWGFTQLTSVWRKKLLFQTYDNLIVDTTIQLNYIQDLKRIRQQQNINSKIKVLLSASLNKIKSLKRQKTDFMIDIEKLDFSNLNEVIDLYSQWRKKHKNYVSLCLNSHYLKWRIANNPVCNYVIYSVKYRNTSIGFAIVNQTSPIYYLVEFICLEKEESSILALLKTLKNNGGARLVYFSNSMNKYNNTITDILIKIGGKTRVNSSMHFVLKHIEPSALDTISINDYYINALWTEGFNM
jgi:hypothetical protein